MSSITGSDEYNEEGFTACGFDRAGFGRDGFNVNGFNRAGFDRTGFNRLGLDRDGFNCDGFNYNHIDRDGYNKEGFDSNGFTRDGFGKDGFDIAGYDRLGRGRRGGQRIDDTGVSIHTMDVYGYNYRGYNKNGYDRAGYDQYGFSRDGFNKIGVDREGFNKNGFNQEGFTREGFNKNGLDIQGFGRDGFSLEDLDRNRFNRDGFDEDGFDRSGYDYEGYNRRGYNKECLDRSGFILPSKWFEFIINATQTPNHQTTWDASEQCKELSDQDRELAYKWAADENDDDYSKAKMLSARMAEIVALKFYRNLGFEVKDISINQVNCMIGLDSNQNQQDWKSHDLLLNDERCIDIKNARTPLNSSVTYFEHCISKFKKIRDNQDVIIAGVVSHYLKFYDIQNPDKIKNTFHSFKAPPHIKFLGETSAPIIHQLQRWFNKREFLKLTISGNNFIPRWVFEYPKGFYKTRDRYRVNLQKNKTKHTPTLDEFSQKNLNPIPAYLSSGIELPEVWKKDLIDWQVRFYDRILPGNNKVITMPILFLAILTHFLEALVKKERWKEYSPTKYHQLLYSELSNEERQMPLGIFDPLETIQCLINTLSILWSHKDSVKLDEFKLFKFNGIGLLEGKRQGCERYETILAYCGGFIDGLGKCGNNPLIVAEHENCPECGKLICEICGHCNEYCSICTGRMKKISNESNLERQSEETTFSPDAIFPIDSNSDDIPF